MRTSEENEAEPATREEPGLVTASGVAVAGMFEAVVSNVDRVIKGNTLAIRCAVACLVAEGHLLIEDVPGVGKTSLGKALARSVDSGQHRIQFTSDLLPSDVTGVNIFDRNTSTFEFRPGPIFSNLVLGDEINRTPPKTQSALLEAMEERQVTIEGTTYPLPRPFMVIATQNPQEHDGTYPLPISQLDRFLMRVNIGYPGASDELGLLTSHGIEDPLEDLQPVISGAEVIALIERAKAVHCSHLVQRYLVDLAHATRSHPAIALGMSPRATLALQRAARAWALLHGRDFVVPDDVKSLALPVVGHRLELRSSRHGARDQVESVISELLAKVPVLDAPHSAA